MVACWGGVITATRGLRAERCRIEALWLAGTVGAGLIDAVRAHYPSVTVCADKPAMLAAYPLTVLDSYDRVREHRQAGRFPARID